MAIFQRTTTVEAHSIDELLSIARSQADTVYLKEDPVKFRYKGYKIIRVLEKTFLVELQSESKRNLVLRDDELLITSDKGEIWKSDPETFYKNYQEITV